LADCVLVNHNCVGKNPKFIRFYQVEAIHLQKNTVIYRGFAGRAAAPSGRRPAIRPMPLPFVGRFANGA